MEDSKEYGNPFHILCYKDTDHVVNIMAYWMNLDDLEGANTKRNQKIRDGDSLVKVFKYCQPFGLHFFYCHHVDDHNNRYKHPISLDRIWDTEISPDCNFSWYIAMSEVNTAISPRHLQNGGNIMPTLDF